MLERNDGAPANRAFDTGWKAQLAGVSGLSTSIQGDPRWMSWVDKKEIGSPFDKIKTIVFPREKFVNDALDRFLKASPEQLHEWGVSRQDNIFAFGIYPYLPMAKRELAFLAHHDGKNETKSDKPHLFKLGGNSMYFEGQGKMVGIDIEWFEMSANLLRSFTKKEDGAMAKLAKVNLSFGGHLNMGVTAFPVFGQGDPFRFAVSREGKVERTDFSYTEVVQEAARLAVPEGLLAA